MAAAITAINSESSSSLAVTVSLISSTTSGFSPTEGFLDSLSIICGINLKHEISNEINIRTKNTVPIPIKVFPAASAIFSTNDSSPSPLALIVTVFTDAPIVSKQSTCNVKI